MNALAKKKRKINTLLYIEVREEDGKYISIISTCNVIYEQRNKTNKKNK